MPNEKVTRGEAVLIANPAAGRGRAIRMLPHVREALAARGVTRVFVTTRPGEEQSLAHAASRDGATTIIALGGDGTWANVARGMLSAGGRARLAILAAGTGNDLAFSTGIPAHDMRAAIEIALGREERRVDVGEAAGVHFLNCCGVGFDAEVVRSISETRWVRGHAVYLLTALRHLLAFPGIDVRVSAPTPSNSQRVLMVVVSNGPRFGGGFLIAPEAQIDDGMLDVVTVSNAPTLRRARLLAMATRGRHVGEPEIAMAHIRELTLSFDAPPLFETDGELHRASSPQLKVRTLPGALRLASARR